MQRFLNQVCCSREGGRKSRISAWLGATALWVGVSVCVPFAEAQFVQRTAIDDASCITANPVSSDDGARIVFESTCDFTGTNVDGNREIFRTQSGSGPVQLTDTVDCTNASPTTRDNGNAIAFDSDCNLTGQNSDGSTEIFLWNGGDLSQLTTGGVCTSQSPSINAAGTVVAFESDCDFLGTNLDFSLEIYRVTPLGVISQLSDDRAGDGCSSFNASISRAGGRVAFESDCDLVGTNEDGVSEIFSVTDQGDVTQLTASSVDTCVSSDPSSDSAGNDISFESDCDFTGGNSDGSIEIFAVNLSGNVKQMTDAGSDGVCESFGSQMTGPGDAVWFTSFCDLSGDNPDQSAEIFRASEGTLEQITDNFDCASFSISRVGTSGAGVFISTCDISGNNGDGGTEIFTVACACGRR